MVAVVEMAVGIIVETQVLMRLRVLAKLAAGGQSELFGPETHAHSQRLV
jgi:hypothetical protein